MAKLQFKFDVDIAGTRDLTPPTLKAIYDIEVSADPDAERALLAYYKANFMKEMEKKLTEQAKAFAVPLTSMQKEIDTLNAARDKAEKAADISRYAEAAAEAAEAAKEVGKRIKEFDDYLKKAVDNTVKQQEKAWLPTFDREAVKAAEKQIKADITNKKIRHAAKIAIIGGLAVTASVTAAVASAASFGTVPVAVAAIGAAVVGIGGLKSLYRTGRMINEAAGLQRKSLEKLQADLDDIDAHFGKAKGKIDGLPKHLDDASRFHTQRLKAMAESEKDLGKLESQISDLEKQLGAAGKVIDSKALKATEDKLRKLKGTRDKVLKALKSAEKENKEFEKLLDQARRTVGDLKAINFTGARTMSTALKRGKEDGTLTDTLIEMADLATGFA